MRQVTILFRPTNTMASQARENLRVLGLYSTSRTCGADPESTHLKQGASTRAAGAVCLDVHRGVYSLPFCHDGFGFAGDTMARHITTAVWNS